MINPKCPEQEVVEKYGGKVVFIPRIGPGKGGYSSTKLRNAIGYDTFKKVRKANCYIIHIPAFKLIIKQYEKKIKELKDEISRKIHKTRKV